MNTKKKDISIAGASLVFGVAFGIIIGSAIGNLGLGLALGSAFGLLFAPRKKQKEATE